MSRVEPASADARQAIDRHFMLLALEQARQAARAGEVPVGCVIAAAVAGRPGGAPADFQVAGAGGNRTRRDGIVAAHAELVALGQAQRGLGDFRLDGAWLYATVEPCLMCLGAIVQSRISRLVYGAAEPKFGALEGPFSGARAMALQRLEVRSGVLAEESAALLSEFFAAVRKEKQGSE